MNVFLTGASGFVGRAVLRKLLCHGHKPVCLLRREGAAAWIEEEGGEVRFGDVRQPETLVEAMQGCDAVIHLVAIIREIRRRGVTFVSVNERATRFMVEAAGKRGIERFIHMSALGADPDGITPYFRTKGRAEEIVRNSGRVYTVFRPSFIFGPGAAVYHLLSRMIRCSPFGVIPIFGRGDYRHQPVHLDNVAEGLVRSLRCSVSERRTYDVGGPVALTYREQIEILGRALGRRVRTLPGPLFLTRPLVRIMGLFPFSPIDLDRLNMLIHDNVCDPGPFARDLEIELIPFAGRADV